MIGSFLQTLESVFSWLLEASWQASILAALVVLLQLALRGRLNPRWRHALWLLVIARLLLPVLPESALSLFQFTPRPLPVITRTVTEPIFTYPPAPFVAGPSLSTASPAYPFSLYTVMALLWLTGVIGFLILTWCVNRRFGRHVAKAPAIREPRLLQIAAAAQAELGIRRSIRLIESTQVQGPAIMGLLHPTLILPPGVRARFSDQEIRFIFLHELAHLKRGDLALQWLIAVLQILHWFNPVLWYAFRRMRTDRETATDALVLSRAGEAQKETYGHVLIKLLEHYHQRHSLPTLVGILEDKDEFKRRFHLISKFTKGAYAWSLLGALVIALLAVVCLTKTKSTELPANASARIPATDAAHIDFQIAGQPVQLSDPAQKDTIQLFKELLVMRYINGTPEQIFHFQMLPNTTLKDIQASGSFLHLAYVNEQAFNVGLHYSFKTKDIWIGLKDSVGAFPGYPGGIIVVTTDKKPPFNLVGGSTTLLVGMGLNAEIYPHLPAEMKKTLDEDRGDYQAYLNWISRKDSSGESINQQAVIAVQAGDVETLKKLIAQGIDLKTIKGEAPTLLFYAESPAVAELLIQQGVEVNARDPSGNTALHRICGMPGPQATAIVRVLLEHGADANASTSDGVTPLMRASNPDTVALLIQHGADVNAKIKGGTTMLQMAAMAKASVFETLLRHGASFDVKKDGPTLMLHAAWVNNTDLIKDLLNRGVDPNVKGVWAMVNGKPDLMLPLTAAVIDGRGQFESVKLLLGHGAKADDVMSDAVFNRRAKIIKFFWDHGVRNIPELTYEVSQGAPVADLQKLLDRGGPVDPPEKTGITPLEDAAMLGNMDAVKLLLAHGANVNRGKLPDPKHPVSEDNPLAFAAAEGQDEVVSYLLSHGARPDYRAVWQAADNSDPYDDQRPRSHFEETVRLLINADALKTVPPNVGGYLLGSAMGTRQGGPNATVLKMLLDAGLSPESPMPYIVENGEKPNTIIGYYRDYYAKYKDNPIYASRVSAIKPLLDMLEEADKSTPKASPGKQVTASDMKAAHEPASAKSFRMQAPYEIQPRAGGGASEVNLKLDDIKFGLDKSLPDKYAWASTFSKSFTASSGPSPGNEGGNIVTIVPTAAHNPEAPSLPKGPTEAEIKAVEDSQTPLMKAFAAQNYTEAHTLLAQGADVNVQDKTGNTALTFLINDSGNSGPFPLDILKTILQRAHDPNPTIYSEFSTTYSDPTLDVSLMAASISADVTRLADMRQAVQILLAHGAKFQGASGPIQEILQAATRGDLAVMQRLVASGTSISSTDANGWSPLLVTIALDYDDAANWLIDHGANVNARTRRGADDPLQYAVRRGRDDLVEKLIAHGAKPDLLDGGLYWAIERNDMRLFQDLMNAGADPKEECKVYGGSGGKRWRQIDQDPLATCIDSGQTAMALTLIEKGVNPEPANVYLNQSFAYLAVAHDRPEILQALLAHGANPLLRDDYGETPLSLAQKLHPDLVPMLQAAITRNRHRAEIAS